MAEFGINILSTFTKKCSLTYVACGLAESLGKRGVPFTLMNVQIDNQPQSPKKGLEQYMAAGIKGLKYPINLYVLPVSVMESLMLDHPTLHSENKIHVGNLWWEFNKLPLEVSANLMRYDVILTHSDFLANLAATELPGTHVINSPLTWPISDGIVANRDLFHLPKSDTLFLFVFDADSEFGTVDAATGYGRKNPFELIDAFQLAFPAGESDVHMAIRSTNIDKPQHSEYLTNLLRIAEADPRIHIIRGEMEFMDVMSLTASCDVYISLHRAEGLGLGMLEAMALGKPVIATAWSGNLSFMDLSCACLVRCRPVGLSNTFRYYGYKMPAGSLWAEPIKEDAVSYMRLIHRDTNFRQTLGRNARLRYETYQASAEHERWVDELFTYWSTFNFLPKIAGKYSAV